MVAVPQRASTEEQKAQRRQAIVGAAEQHLADVGFEAFSMAQVGQLAGLAKGTLYLYFETREVLLMGIYLAKLANWASSLGAARSFSRDAAFAEAYYEAAYANPGFLPLMSRLDSVIEHNVPLAILIEAKCTMAATLDEISASLTTALELSQIQVDDAVVSLGVPILGASQVDAGPNLRTGALPADVRRFVDNFSSKDVFTANACRILAGIRKGA